MRQMRSRTNLTKSEQNINQYERQRQHLMSPMCRQEVARNHKTKSRQGRFQWVSRRRERMRERRGGTARGIVNEGTSRESVLWLSRSHHRADQTTNGSGERVKKQQRRDNGEWRSYMDDSRWHDDRSTRWSFFSLFKHPVVIKSNSSCHG